MFENDVQEEQRPNASIKCGSENMLTHETTNWAQSNMSKWAKTDKFQTKLTQLLIARNIGVKGNLTKLSTFSICPLKPMVNSTLRISNRLA